MTKESDVWNIYNKYIKNIAYPEPNVEISQNATQIKQELTETPRQSLESEIDQYFSYSSESEDIRVNNLEFNAKKSMRKYEITKIRSAELEFIHVFISIMKPTSVDAERAFSMAGLFCLKGGRVYLQKL